jgi:hypothetical protein
MGELQGKEPLSKESEEYNLLRDVCREFLEQQTGSTSNKSGNATQKVIRDYLTKKRLKLPDRTKVKIVEVKTRMNLLYLLKPDVSTNKSEYSSNDLRIVLKIINNAVGSEDRSKVMGVFKKFKQFNGDLKFAVVVLSENAPYKYALRQKDYHNIAKVFTLILRENSAQELYREETVEQLERAGELTKPKSYGLDELLTWLTM